MLEILGDSLSHITWKFSICHVFFHLFHLHKREINSFVINGIFIGWPRSTARKGDHFFLTNDKPTKFNRFRKSAFIHQLPSHGIVFGSNLNSELNLSHDLRIMHNKWHQISSIASSATCRWAIAVEICQNRHSNNLLFEILNSCHHLHHMRNIPAISYAQHVGHCFE